MPESTPPSVVRPSLLGAYAEIVCGMSTRNGGRSPQPFGMNLSFNVGDDEDNVRKNRDLFFSRLGIPLDGLAIPRQIHGARVRRVDGPGTYPDTDALTTNRGGVFLCVSVADCVPILLFDRVGKAVAAVHAGWRGTCSRLAELAVGTMAADFGTKAADIVAFIGPAAGVCCYCVGADVADKVAAGFLHRRAEKVHLDLKAANLDQLTSAGVPPGQVEVSPLCTVCEERLFHSYRRDKERSGRMMAVIGLAE